MSKGERKKQTIQVPMALTSSVSGAASGIVSALLTAAAGVTLDSLKGVLKDYMGHNMGVAWALRYSALSGYYEIVENQLDADYKLIIDSLKAGIGQGVGATHAGLVESILGTGNLLAVYNAVIHQEAIQPRLARWAREFYRPAAPDSFTAFQMFRRGAQDRAFFVSHSQLEGWPDELIPGLERAYATVPAISALNDLYWRGKIDDGAWTRAAKGLLFDDDMVEALKSTREVIPPLADLINMAVKEAFPVPAGRPQFEAMQGWAMRRGLNPWWVERYWLAHFFRMDVGRALDNWHRGYWTEERLRSHLLLMDMHPEDHDAIIRVAYSVPSRLELRWGWEAGIYSDEDILKYMRWRRLSPEDAEKAAATLKAYALNEERNSLLREWLTDFEDGLIQEYLVRLNMDQLGISKVRQDYYVERAKVRRDRNYKRRVVDLLEDGYLKDLVTDDELKEGIAMYILDPETAKLRYQEAWIKKYRKPKAPAA